MSKITKLSWKPLTWPKYLYNHYKKIQDITLTWPNWVVKTPKKLRCVWLKYPWDVKNHKVVLKTSNMTKISLQSLKKNPRYHSNMAKLSGFDAIMVIFKIFSILIILGIFSATLFIFSVFFLIINFESLKMYFSHFTG